MRSELDIYNLAIKYPSTIKFAREVERITRAEVIEECIDTLYEVTPQTIDQKLDMVFVNALRRLKENK